MINSVYRLTAPGMIEVNCNEIDLKPDCAIIHPLRLSICRADQRYYTGMRSEAALKAKLPMALIHECLAQVVYDPTGTWKAGDLVVPVPNEPTETDPIVAENYLRSSHFRSSGYDGFLQDYISMKPDRMVGVSANVNPNVAAFTELVSVSTHMLSRFETKSHKRRDVLGVWGDGNLGYITALLVKAVYPDSELYVFGNIEEKLSYFTFADKTIHVDHVPDGIAIDHAFECVGGGGCRPAINQMIDYIRPEGTISLMGVSENFVDINTRMVLEKGLTMFGSSRSGVADFQRTVDLFESVPKLTRYLENLVGDVVPVRTIADIHTAFQMDLNRKLGKTIMKWEK